MQHDGDRPVISHPVLVGLAVAVAIVLSAELSRRTRVPEPCYLVLAGLAVSGVPGIADVRLPPHVVFYGFLPPLLYSAAFLTAPREVRENWLSILLLAVGLTTATMFAVAGVAWGAVAVLGAGTSFLLGAVLGPTDPVSASGVIGSTSAPEKLRTILEGESLVNDGIALVAFSITLTAVEKGNISVGNGLIRFVEVSAGGVAIGLLVAVVVEWVRRSVHDAHLGFGSARVSASELDARRAMAEAALERLHNLAQEEELSGELVGSLRRLYEGRIERLHSHRADGEVALEEFEQAHRALLGAERAELRRREREGTIDFATARRIERELDYQESGLRS